MASADRGDRGSPGRPVGHLGGLWVHSGGLVGSRSDPGTRGLPDTVGAGRPPPALLPTSGPGTRSSHFGARGPDRAIWRSDSVHSLTHCLSSIRRDFSDLSMARSSTASYTGGVDAADHRSPHLAEGTRAVTSLNRLKRPASSQAACAARRASPTRSSPDGEGVTDLGAAPRTPIPLMAEAASPLGAF